MAELLQIEEEPVRYECKILSVIETVVHPKYIDGVGGGMHKIPITTQEQLMEMIQKENLRYNGFGIYRSTFLNEEKMISVRHRPSIKKG